MLPASAWRPHSLRSIDFRDVNWSLGIVSWDPSGLSRPIPLSDRKLSIKTCPTPRVHATPRREALKLRCSILDIASRTLTRTIPPSMPPKFPGRLWKLWLRLLRLNERSFCSCCKLSPVKRLKSVATKGWSSTSWEMSSSSIWSWTSPGVRISSMRDKISLNCGGPSKVWPSLSTSFKSGHFSRRSLKKSASCRPSLYGKPMLQASNLEMQVVSGIVFTRAWRPAGSNRLLEMFKLVRKGIWWSKIPAESPPPLLPGRYLPASFRSALVDASMRTKHWTVPAFQ